MSRAMQEKWDRRFREAQQSNDPAWVLSRNTHLLPRQGRALDLACGLGGNALLLARHGLQVDALDLSRVAVDKLRGFAAALGLEVNPLQWDIENRDLPEQRYDVILCCHYLHRPLCSSMQHRLNPGGLLYYQTFTPRQNR